VQLDLGKGGNILLLEVRLINSFLMFQDIVNLAGTLMLYLFLATAARLMKAAEKLQCAIVCDSPTAKVCFKITRLIR
jgi:hypothetical protein